MQIVGYDTGVGGEATRSSDANDRSDQGRPRDADDPSGPALLIGRDGTVERQSLAPGTDLAYTLGERHCAGAIDGERHLACAASEAPYCPQHTSRWPCARCRGDCAKPVEACDEEHAVYLAAFAPATFKVGVTRSWRLRTRLREQGADRAAHVRTVEDGRIARQIEADVAETVGDRVRVPTKIEGLHRTVDDSAWQDLLAGFDPIATYEFDYGLSLSDRPVAETLASGRVLGTQGRVLVLELDASRYAVDVRDLVGYELSHERSTRQRQASLGAFE